MKDDAIKMKDDAIKMKEEVKEESLNLSFEEEREKENGTPIRRTSEEDKNSAMSSAR